MYTISTDAASGNLRLSSAVEQIRKLRDVNCVENAHAINDCIVGELNKQIFVTINCGM